MGSSKVSASDPVLIKKYGNRRLYDTRKSGYITLEDLATIVQGGDTIRVVDANSGKDLTRQVLTQVILEQQERLDMIPVELLHTIIRTQGTLQQGPFTAFLSGVARQAASAGSLLAQQMASLFSSVPGFGQAARADATGGDREVAAPGKDEQLKRLEELQERLDALLKKQKEDPSKA
jgi:polyhydroxyalkanoate synthesis repressor PhaR